MTTAASYPSTGPPACTRGALIICLATAPCISCWTRPTNRPTWVSAPAPAEKQSTMSIRTGFKTASRFFFHLFVLGICVALPGCSRDPTDDLVARLHDPNVEVRRAAVRTLFEHPPSDQRLVAELEKTLTDKDS